MSDEEPTEYYTLLCDDPSHEVLLIDCGPRGKSTRPHRPDGPEAAKSPLPAEKPQVGGLRVGDYFFLPWFLTASIAAAAASGSRYLPPGVRGRKSVSRS